jgi:lipid-A-disaccharide synthase
MAQVRTIFISVAEDSADGHLARLVQTARASQPDWRFRGLTGPRLRAAGVETVFDFAQHAAMIGGVVKVLGTARRALAAAAEDWRKHRPDLVVVADSSALHLRMAKAAKLAGLPVLYYIAPQTWASRAWRNEQIRKYVDRLACILPFEAAYFEAQGIDCEFVGHPLFESLADEHPDPRRVSRWRVDNRPVIAILPGSRKGVIAGMLPLQLDVVRRMQFANDQRPRILISAIDDQRAQQIHTWVDQQSTGSAGSELEVVTADNASLLSAADLVLVASGTATLHVANYHKPMIVMYDAGGWLYWPWRMFGGLMLKLRHLSLVNLLTNERVVPEFMPFVRDPGMIARTAENLLRDHRWRRVMTQRLAGIVDGLRGSAPSLRVLQIMSELMTGDASSGVL